MLQDNFNGVSQDLEYVPYVNTNRSPHVWPQLHEHLAMISLVERGRILVQSFRSTPSPLVYKVLWGRCCVACIPANPDPSMALGTEMAFHQARCSVLLLGLEVLVNLLLLLGFAEHLQGTESILPHRNLSGRNEIRWGLTVFEKESVCWENI